MVKRRMQMAEKVVSDEKTKRENIRNRNKATKDSMGLNSK